MMMPPDDFLSGSIRSTTTRSCSGRNFIDVLQCSTVDISWAQLDCAFVGNAWTEAVLDEDEKAQREHVNAGHGENRVEDTAIEVLKRDMPSDGINAATGGNTGFGTPAFCGPRSITNVRL
jgi:hypothetical protein